MCCTHSRPLARQCKTRPNFAKEREGFCGVFFFFFSVGLACFFFFFLQFQFLFFIFAVKVNYFVKVLEVAL